MTLLVERTLAAVVAIGVGVAGQYLGATAPAQDQSLANRDANWSARDALGECNEERRDLLDRLLDNKD